jgi:hypothetical protein
MQYRGRNRINKLPQGNFSVLLTDGQYEPLGMVVGHLYYGNAAMMSFVPQYRPGDDGVIGQKLSFSGYPHNGGEHTMTLYGPKEDLVAFLELVSDFYQNSQTRSEGAQIALTLARELSAM